MLIVVAIIAILIAISIPLVDSALQRSKHATDAANERAAKAAMLVEYLEGNVNTDAYYAYDAKNGKILITDGAKTPKNFDSVGYGQHKGRNTEYFVIVKVKASDGTIEMGWCKKTSSFAVDTTSGMLCGDKTAVNHS